MTHLYGKQEILLWGDGFWRLKSEKKLARVLVAQ